MLRADVERMLPFSEPQQHGPIPVWAAPLNYREVDLPGEHLAELDSMVGEVMCHAAHNISWRLFSDRESTVARRASSATFAHKPSAQSRPSGPGIGETPERLLESTAERSNIFGELTSYLQVPEHTGLRRPVSGKVIRPVSGAPTLTRSKLLLIGMKLLRRQFGRRQHSGKKLPQFREGRVGLRLRTAPLLTGPAASSHQRCFQRPHTYRH